MSNDIYHKPTKEFLRAICKPECLIMGPVMSPSIPNLKVPIHLSARKLFSFPETLEILGQEMGKIALDLKPDMIAAIEMSGIPIATIISIFYKIPMVIVRKEKRESPRFSVEGQIKPGQSYVLIDDGISGGAHKKLAVEFIEETGGKVTDIVVIADVIELEAAGIDLGREWLENKGIKIHYFISWLGWFEQMHKYGFISGAIWNLISDYFGHIKEWQISENKWKWFEEIKKRQKGKFV